MPYYCGELAKKMKVPAGGKEMSDKVKNLLLYFNETPNFFKVHFIEYDYFFTMADYM